MGDEPRSRPRGAAVALPAPLVDLRCPPDAVLLDVLALLREDGCGPQLGAPSRGGWLTLPAAFARRAGWFAEGIRREGDRRAAASFLAGGYLELPMVLVGAPWVLAGLHVEATAERLHVHRHAEGWFDRSALDPRAVHRDPGPSATAAAIVELAGPLVATLDDELPLGRMAMWGAAADALGWYVAHVSRRTGADATAAWSRLQALFDAVAVQLDAPLTRPTLLSVTWTGRSRGFSRRGTCCLAYRRIADADPAGEGYCTTCPLRAEDVTRARLVTHLAETAATTDD